MKINLYVLILYACNVLNNNFIEFDFEGCPESVCLNILQIQKPVNKFSHSFNLIFCFRIIIN